MPDIGERIYKLRVQNNMSQDALAQALNVSRQAVSKWENNVSIPDLDKIAALSRLFSVTTDELIKGEIPPEINAPNEKETIIISDNDSGFSKRKVTQILGIILIVLGFVSAVLVMVLTWQLWIVALLSLVAVDGVVLLVSQKRPWLMLCFTNLIILLVVLLVLLRNFSVTRRQTDLQVQEEIYSVEPDVSMIVE